MYFPTDHDVDCGWLFGSLVGGSVGRWIDDVVREKELMMMGRRRRSNKKIDSLTGSECRIGSAID